MVHRCLSAGSVLLFASSLAACTVSNSPPTTPDPTPTVTLPADGSTLKASAPPLVSPANGFRFDSLVPELIVGAATSSFGSNPGFEYRIEVQDMNGQPVVNSPKLSQAFGGQTRWSTPNELTANTRYKWRARVESGASFGPWSPFSEFLTLEFIYKGLTPRPPFGNWPRSGPAVVSYITQVFPQYLHPTALTATRIEHMEFLRDRIIEAGICGGLDLARNLKRGVGPHSHDAIAWRTPTGKVEVVDIASAFDDKTIHLELHWAIVSGPPGYDPYRNHPGC